MSKSKCIRIMVACDYPMVRLGLASIIERESDMTVIGQASNAWEAKEIFCQQQPSVSIMNLRLFKLSGAATIQTLLTQFDSANILISTNNDSKEDIYSGIEAGAKGYLHLYSTPEEIKSAIRAVASGKSYISPIVATKLKESMKKPKLSARELEILQLITNGKRNHEIATTLYVTEGTVGAMRFC
jgi:two-component system, NarL family, response regulator